MPIRKNISFCARKLSDLFYDLSKFFKKQSTTLYPFTAINDLEPVDMFLDPTKIKDYMHVNDYCDAVFTAIKGNHWYQDWNVAAELPLMTGEIVDLIGQVTGLNVKDKVMLL